MICDKCPRLLVRIRELEHGDPCAAHAKRAEAAELRAERAEHNELLQKEQRDRIKGHWREEQRLREAAEKRVVELEAALKEIAENSVLSSCGWCLSATRAARSALTGKEGA